jgi:ATP-dependent RNA helicase DDX35
MPLPLHAGLSNEQQLFVFEPAPSQTRKVVISTNIAEASITIDNIRYVIDSGFVKLRTYNPRTGMDVLSIAPASQASLAQRAGRAGRTSSGKCFRLFPEAALASLPKSTVPEICRSDVSLFVLQLKALGIENILRFDFLTPPPSSMLVRALEFLYSLKALDEYGRLTRPLGMHMAEVRSHFPGVEGPDRTRVQLPVDPMMAKIVLDSHSYGCSEEVLSIAAMTSVQVHTLADVLCQHVELALHRTSSSSARAAPRGRWARSNGASSPPKKATTSPCSTVRLPPAVYGLIVIRRRAPTAFNGFIQKGRKSAKWCHQHRLNFKALSRAVSIRMQLRKYLQRFDVPLVSCGDDHAAIRRCLASGYFKKCGSPLRFIDRILLTACTAPPSCSQTGPTGASASRPCVVLGLDRSCGPV